MFFLGITHIANYLRFLTEVSCSPSAASPREARNSPVFLPFVSGRERESERGFLKEKKSGKIVRSHFDEVRARVRS